MFFACVCDVGVVCVVFCSFLAAQISLFFVCLSEEEKSPFLIFLIFLLCVSSLSVLPHHNKNNF